MIFPDPYQKVADEIAANDLDQALWVRSWAESGGEHSRATAIYIRLRVAEIHQFNQEAVQITNRVLATAALAKRKSEPRFWQRTDDQPKTKTFLQYLVIWAIYLPLVFFLLVGLGTCFYGH